MRVLHVQDHTLPVMSGYAFRSAYLVRAEKELGMEVEVVSSARHRSHQGPVEEIDGMRFHRTPWPAGPWRRAQLALPFWRERVLNAALVRRVMEAARSFRPHVLHASSPLFNGWAALEAGRRLGVPVVYHLRAFWEDDAVDKRKIREWGFVYRQVRRLETRVCRRAAGLVVICEGVRRDLVERGLPPERILVVPNGVDGDHFRPTAPEPALARAFGVEGRRVVGFAGSFFRYEGLPLLVEAAARIRKRHPDARLLLVGGGEDEERVRARIREHGLEDRVLLPGRVPHERVAGLYGLMEVVAYPRLSRRITELVTPLKPLEALAMGKVVVGSDVGGLRELLEGCPAARVFRAGDAGELAAVLGNLLDEPPDRLRGQGSRGREWVLDRHRWRVLVEPLKALYESLARGGSPAAAGSLAGGRGAR